MTKSDKQQIYGLRLKGLGYKSIATVLGLSRDSVKNYCKRHHLCGPAKAVKLNVPIIKEKHNTCLNCDTLLTQQGKGRARKFCSDECRREWWKANADRRTKKETAMYHFTCPYCHKEFSAYGNIKRKYCSHNCYINDRFGEIEKPEGSV